MKTAYFKTVDGDGGTQILLQGDWVIDHSGEIRADLRSFPHGDAEAIDASGIGQVDTRGILQLQALRDETGGRLILAPAQQKIFNFLSDKAPAPQRGERSSPVVRLVEGFGKNASNAWKTIFGILSTTGCIPTSPYSRR